ncbi:MAG: hypothetical protein D6675_03125 [Gemmatimonadetes bacterium]|nr:MAG: hypothetical protein D6675_03125 [Gemmatimonadota bacterium]
MKHFTRYFLIVSAIFGLYGLVGCGNRDHADFAAITKHRSLPEQLEHITEPNTNGGVTIDALVAEITTVDAIGLPPDIQPFQVKDRLVELSKYPCLNCHSKSIEQLKIEQADSLRNAHWDVELNHAPEHVMKCGTCHNEENFDQLKTLNGEPVSFSHSYLICAQCHSQQHEDWMIGAHGKRLGGWAPPRVVNNCTHCHNQHQPAWGKRWPARVTQTVH